MLPTLCNKRGFSLIEAVIAIFLTTVAVMSIFDLVATAWRTTSQSDSLGRAANILYDRLQQEEARILNPCSPVATGVTGPVTVYAGGSGAPQSGDMSFNVTTTVTATGIGSNDTWHVNVRVSWGNHAGISESLVVTRQDDYRFPEGCTDAVL